MKNKKLVLCIIIAVVFSFGIRTTNVLADGTQAIQATEEINEDTNASEIEEIDVNIEDADNIEDVVDVDDLVELEDDEDDEDVELLENEATDLKVSSNKETKEVTKTEKTTKETTEAKATKTKKATVKKTVVKKYTNSELRLLSALIYSEAGNQSYKGKLAVGNVVLNRVKSSAYSHTNSVKEVIYDKKWGVQFSVIKKGSNGTSPISRALSLYDTRTSASGEAKENMLECIKAAKTALNGENNIGSYLYFNRTSSYLSNKYSNHVIIGEHIFYNTK